MKLTPVFQFPYVEPTDPARNYPATTKSMVETIEAALLNNGRVPVGSDVASFIARLNALEAGTRDTGWQAIPVASGYVADAAEPPQWRKIGHLVVSRGQVGAPGGGSLAAGVMANYPAEARPTFRSIWSQNSAANGFARVIMNPSGAVNLGAPTVASSYVRFDGMTWTDN